MEKEMDLICRVGGVLGISLGNGKVHENHHCVKVLGFRGLMNR